MRIVFISDTHEQHDSLKLPDGDVLIHAGDMTSRGELVQLEGFIHWCSRQNYKHKVFIAGNHDFFLENAPTDMIKAMLPSNTHYLCNSSIKIKGINIYGSPVTPYFHNWAFNYHRGEDIRHFWKMIPSRTDILITHGAPYGILDKTVRGDLTGCEDLLAAINRIKPKYHLFGHIHEAYGTCQDEHTIFINGSVLDEHYQLANAPVIFDI